MNTAAMHWNMAAPSMLTVAPMGRMKRLMRLSTPLFSSTHFIMDGSVAELRGEEGNDRRASVSCDADAQCHKIPGAGGEGGGEGRDEARQEAVGVLACEAEVDEGQDDASVNNVPQDGGKDVFPQTSDQKNHVFHLHNLTSNQEHDTERNVPVR